MNMREEDPKPVGFGRVTEYLPFWDEAMDGILDIIPRGFRLHENMTDPPNLGLDLRVKDLPLHQKDASVLHDIIWRLIQGRGHKKRHTFGSNSRINRVNSSGTSGLANAHALRLVFFILSAKKPDPCLHALVSNKANGDRPRPDVLSRERGSQRCRVYLHKHEKREVDASKRVSEDLKSRSVTIGFV